MKTHSNCILISSALFLTGVPSYGRTLNLRRRLDNTNSSLSYTHVNEDSPSNDRLHIKEEDFEHGFEVVGSAPYHEPIANTDHDIEWAQTEDDFDEDEGDLEQKQYIYDESLSFVSSCMQYFAILCHFNSFESSERNIVLSFS